MAMQPGRVGVSPDQVDLFGKILGGGSGGDSYTKAESGAKFLAKTDASSTYLSKTDAASTYAAKTDLDGWTAASQVQSDNTVTFTGLDDAYGYDLYCVDKLISVSSVVKTGSGTSVTLVYTVTGATAGDSCKLRILK